MNKVPIILNIQYSPNINSGPFGQKFECGARNLVAVSSTEKFGWQVYHPPFFRAFANTCTSSGQESQSRK